MNSSSPTHQTILLSIISALFFVIILSLIYVNFIRKPEIVYISQTSSPTPSLVNSWQKYENKKYNFEIYHPSLTITESQGADSQLFQISFGNFKQDHGFVIGIYPPNSVNLLDQINLENGTNVSSAESIRLISETGLKYNYQRILNTDYADFTKAIIRNQYDYVITTHASEASQILSTFKITNQPTNSNVTPTNKPVTLVKVNIQDTGTWKEYTCGSISFKLPDNYNQKCVENPDNSFTTTYGESGKYYAGGITIGQYDGGSRRQHWIKIMNATSKEVEKYVRFQESLYGSVVGLDVFASGGWWQGGYASSILIANNKTLVSFHCGHNFDDQSNKITRDEIADTIASTIKFL